MVKCPECGEYMELLLGKGIFECPNCHFWRETTDQEKGFAYFDRHEDELREVGRGATVLED